MASAQASGLALDHLKDVTFFDDGFDVRGHRHSYSSVRHLEFTAQATRHSVNLIPTGTSYASVLALHMQDGRRVAIPMEQRAFRKKDGFEAILRAAAILGDVTFGHRLAGYETHLDKHGFIEWGRHQINKDGRLYRDNKFFLDLRKEPGSCKLGPFEMECSRPGGVAGFFKKAFPRGEKVDLSIDRDCFVYIMKHRFGLSWAKERVPEKPRDRQKEFKEALLLLGGQLCKLDGHVSRDEILVFKRHFGIDEETMPGSAKLFRAATERRGSPAATATQIRDLLEGRREVLEYIVIGLMQVAAADGVIGEDEEAFIRTVSAGFSIPRFDTDMLFALFEHAFGSEETEDENAGRASSAAYGVFASHLRVLGLGPEATIVEIKASYREMARRHHPDLLRASGVPIDAMKASEEILKAINASYAWLMRNHPAAQASG